MPRQIADSEFPHVVSLLRAMLLEAGLGAWEIEPWIANSAARLTRLHRENAGAYFVFYCDGHPVGMAGAQLHDRHAFLSLQTGRYGRVVDEFVLPAHRGNGLEQKLRDAALAWLARQNVPALEATPPNVARLDVLSRGGKL